jgi:HD-GYP domain-containing protein (c-di-GMP phosphodiesterase class II)
MTEISDGTAGNQPAAPGGTIQQSQSSGVRLAEVVAALSRATDLAMGQPLEFALCSCVLAVRIGEELRLDERVLRRIYYQSLLRYIGCNADTETLSAFVGDELALRSEIAEVDSVDRAAVMRIVIGRIRAAHAGESPLAVARDVVRGLTALPRFLPGFFAGHCEVAERLAERLGFEPDIVRALGQLYERWDGKGLPKGLKGESIDVAVRVVTLAQDVVIHHRLGGIDAAVAICQDRRGGVYDPRIADLFGARAASLCAGLDGEPEWDAILDLEPGARTVLSEHELDVACEAIADFGDLKSTFTAGHSRGVADLASRAATAGGLSGQEVVMLRRGGLIHDVGRVAVSAGIWAKAGPLSEREWEQVRLHPYNTERIFVRPVALHRIAAIASYDHERLDGSGYHRGVRGGAIPLTARILAAADAYQAMTELRPYRPAYPADTAASLLRREVVVGRLDGDSVSVVLEAAGHRERSRPRHVAGLTEREIDVLRLIAQGSSRNQVAAELFISPKTADNHIQHIYDKIGVSTRAGATLFAIENNVLQASPKIG